MSSHPPPQRLRSWKSLNSSTTPHWTVKALILPRISRYLSKPTDTTRALIKNLHCFWQWAVKHRLPSAPPLSVWSPNKVYASQGNCGFGFCRAFGSEIHNYPATEHARYRVPTVWTRASGRIQTATFKQKIFFEILNNKNFYKFLDFYRRFRVLLHY